MSAGTSIVPIANPQKNGYVFSGWGAVPSVMPARDVDIYGTFTRDVSASHKGKDVMIKASNYDTYIMHKNGSGITDYKQNAAFTEDMIFTVVNGLSNSAGVSLRSANYPNAYLAVSGDGSLKLTDYSPAMAGSATFILSDAANGNAACVSFRLLSDPSRYIRHRSNTLFCEAVSGALGNADASFYIEVPSAPQKPVPYFGETVMIKASNYESYMMHKNGNGITESVQNAIFAEDMYFTLVTGLSNSAGVSIVSVNYPDSYLAVSGDGSIKLTKRSSGMEGSATFKLTDALNGNAACVSFQLFSDASRYVRHRAGILYCEAVSGALGNADASFVVTNNLLRPNVTKTMSNTIDRNRGLVADPFITYANGNYYYLLTQGLKISIRRSNTLAGLANGEEINVFWENPGGPVISDIWAPEMYKIGDRWYIYACGVTRPGDFGSIRMFCLESNTGNPFDGFYFKSFLAPEAHAIDQTVMVDETSGRLYTAYSQFTHIGQVIIFAEMDNPWTVGARRLQVSYPEYDWEKRGSPDRSPGPVNEGPIFLQRNGRIFLVYSASGCWSEYYCLGMVSIQAGTDYFNINNWQKSPNPLFSSANGICGVGHNAFFKSPDGTEDWIVFHAKDDPGGGEGNRYGYYQKINWDVNGYPVFGVPLGKDKIINVPSGE